MLLKNVHRGVAKAVSNKCDSYSICSIRICAHILGKIDFWMVKNHNELVKLDGAVVICVDIAKYFLGKLK